MITSALVEEKYAIPINYIEQQIRMLQDQNNEFANLTAVMFKSLIRKWRDDTNGNDK